MILSKRNNAVVPVTPCTEPRVGRKRNVSLPQYKANKIKILQRDFCMHLTDKEIEHLNALLSETEVDRYIRELMHKRWD